MEITFFAICIGLIATLTGGLIMVRALRNAPEGFEDAEGFHVVHATQSAAYSHAEAAPQESGLGLLV